MNTKIPSYLYDKANINRLIFFTAIFALLFVNIFQPFGSRDWYPNISDFKYFFFSSLIVLIGMLVVVISRYTMLQFVKKHSVTYLRYAFWVLAEILSMSLFYSLITKFIPEEGMNRDFVEIFHKSTVNTSLVLLLPYSILWLYFSWRDKNNLLQKMVTDDHSTGAQRKNLIAFPDEKGELRITIMLENLLYIDSSDNYITIHYLNKSKLSHFLIRNTLKWMDENLTNDSQLVRCHRSFIVNLDKVKVIRKDKGGITMELDVVNTPDIPVSNTYYDRVMSKFSHYSK